MKDKTGESKKIKIPFWRQRLGIKFIVFFVLAQILIATALSFTTIYYMRLALGFQRKQQMENSAALVAASVLPNIFNNDLVAIQAQVDKVIEKDKTGELLFVGVYDGEGRALAERANPLAPRLSSQELKNKSRVLQISQPIVDAGQYFGRVDLFSAQEQISENVKRASLWVIILVALFTIAATQWVMFFVFRWVVQPITRLSEGASRISHGDLDQRIGIDSGDELEDLAEAFNAMAISLKAREKELSKAHEQLKESYQRLQVAHKELQNLDDMKSEFVAIASHELRTPISTVKAYAEMLLSERLGRINRKCKDSLEVIERSVDRLTRVVNDLIDLSRLERGRLGMEKEQVALDRILEEIVEEFAPIAKDKRLSLAAQISDRLPSMIGDPLRLHQVFANLLSNAVKFTPEGGKILIGAHSSDGTIEISVSDTGIGIPAGEIPKIFTLFHQTEKITTRRFKGMGLGLAITKMIVESHGGKIKVDSEEGRGSTFTCVFPVEGRHT